MEGENKRRVPLYRVAYVLRLSKYRKLLWMLRLVDWISLRSRNRMLSTASWSQCFYETLTFGISVGKLPSWKEEGYSKGFLVRCHAFHYEVMLEWCKTTNCTLIFVFLKLIFVGACIIHFLQKSLGLFQLVTPVTPLNSES